MKNQVMTSLMVVIVALVLIVCYGYPVQADGSYIPLSTPGVFEVGVAVNQGNARGVVVTKCGITQFECILALLMDFTETTTFTMFGMIVIEALTGKTIQTVPIPGSPVGGVVASAYASLLNGRYYYTHFGATFYQFDSLTMNFTFYQRTHVGMAMSLTMDDDGQIWGGTYPKCGLFSFSPNNVTLRDYGFVYNQTWDMYPRSIASDDLGFIYMGIAFTRAQFIAFNPRTQQAYPLIAEPDRLDGSGTIYRDLDGAVYGNAGSSILHKLYNGSMISNVKKAKTPKTYYSGNQGYVYRVFPSGNLLITFDVVNKSYTIKLVNGTEISREFTYTCRGANIMDMVASPDKNQLIGSTSFPMTMFALSVNTKNGNTSNDFVNKPALDQWNTMKSVEYDENVWIGTYPEGRLLQYNPKKPYVYTEIGNNQSNPLFIGTSSPHVNRPSCVLIHPNMEHVLMSGEPAYGKTGGGLLIWNRKLLTNVVLNHTQLLTYHSIYSMSALPNSNVILCGTTTAPGTGGQKIATEAELFLFDLTSQSLVKRFKPFKGVSFYYELFHCTENNYIYGYTDLRVFFVYNPITQSIIHNKTIDRVFTEQGPHSFATHPKTKETFLTTSGGVYKINATDFSFSKIFQPKLNMFNAVILNDGFYYFRASTKVYAYKLFNVTVPVQPSQSFIADNSGNGNRTTGNSLSEASLGGMRSLSWMVVYNCILIGLGVVFVL